eukprot:CAMPEP_0203712546 /NCGR_PEP_ID=MMETSP0091-20130426/70089_1 /ASSEMBLY_ACC=CAM_ASM_001089 /TAXON_ID=426623 /ORGANISM="Chaetoceros affinis, Strain CCMP159" /LENGTH=255 /DNA_ID=CAMNT_0050590527 /DNA_START=320 /DNA_END=1087 /DNA_ORIENTATION=+
MEEARKRFLGYYKDALKSARKYVEESKARQIAATAATPTEVTEASPVAVPTSGSYIATKKTSRYSPSDERFASTDSQYKSQAVKAEFNLVFTPDEEYGYTIRGKGIDKYGQSIIEEGYMTTDGTFYWVEEYIASFANKWDKYGQSIIEEGYMTTDGTFYWVEEYIASFANKWEDSSGNVHQDQPDVAGLNVLIKGCMTQGQDSVENSGNVNILEGVWMMNFAEIKGGAVTMTLSPHGFAPVANISVIATEAVPVS